MFLVDTPIRRPEDDLLGRSHFADQIARAVASWTGTESLVIGLYGDWGSGKTSIINLIERHFLRTEDQSPEIGFKRFLRRLGVLNRSMPSSSETTTVFNFSPWSFSGHVTIEHAFFSELARVLGLKSEEGDGLLARRLVQYSKALELLPEPKLLRNLISLSISVVVLAGGLWGLTEIRAIWGVLVIGSTILGLGMWSQQWLKMLSEFLDARAVVQQRSPDQLKQLISGQLHRRKKKLLIVIDDIDRLTKDEVRRLVKLIRINADFPNTIYLAAFDRLVVEAHLDESNVPGSQYLEKIVQASFDVPQIRQQKVQQFLSEELDKICRELPARGKRLISDQHWQDVFNSGFKQFFGNLREVKRYISSLAITFPLLKREKSIEVNPADFFAIEAIRVFCPKLYKTLKSERLAFTTVPNELSTDAERVAVRTTIDKTLDNISDERRIVVANLLQTLFPQISATYSSSNPPYSVGAPWEWRRDLRVCSEEMFDKFFRLSIGDSDEISQYELALLAETSSSKSELINQFRKYISLGKIRTLFSELEYHGAVTFPQESVSNLTQAIFDISDELPFDDRTFLASDTCDIATSLVVDVLGQEKVRNCRVLKAAIENSSGLYGPLSCVWHDTRAGRKQPQEQYMVDEVCLKDLQMSCVRLIQSYSPDELIQHRKLPFILQTWKYWDSTDSWKSFIEYIQSNDQRLLDSLYQYRRRILSTGGRVAGAEVRYEFDFRALREVMNEYEIRARLNTIQEREMLTEKQKRTIVIFKETPMDLDPDARPMTTNPPGVISRKPNPPTIEP